MNFSKLIDTAEKVSLTLSDKMPDFSKNQDFRMDQVATIKEVNLNPESNIDEISPYSTDINSEIRSIEELKIYLDSGLEESTVADRPALIRDDIDLEQLDDDGLTNLERMEKGRPPLDKDGKPIELHHIGQKPDSPLAELTQDEHRGRGNSAILHDNSSESLIDRQEFQKEKREYWKARAEQIKQGE